MRATTTTMTLAAVAALTLAACSAPADESAAIDTESMEWANPDAPDLFKFASYDLVSGDVVDGTDLLYKDVVLWFWAPWCPVCDAEASALAAAMEEFPEDVVVLGVAGLGSTETSETFIEDHPGIENFPHIYDEDGSLWAGFGVTGQPTLVLINEDGTSRSHSGAYAPQDIVDKVAWLDQA